MPLSQPAGVAQATFDDHSARHENGGADEIDATGLTGAGGGGGGTPNVIYAESSTTYTSAATTVQFGAFYDENIDDITAGITAALAAIGLSYATGVFTATENGVWAFRLSFTPASTGSGLVSLMKMDVPSALGSEVITQWGVGNGTGYATALPTYADKARQWILYLVSGDTLTIRTGGSGSAHDVTTYTVLEIIRVL